MARSAKALLLALPLPLFALPVHAAPADGAIQPYARCLTVDAKPALTAAVEREGQLFFDGKNKSNTAMMEAVKALAGDCAARLGWSAPVRDAAGAYLWFLANESILSRRVSANGVKPEGLLAFAQALPETDRRPFFDPRFQPDAAFRQRMLAALDKAGFRTTNPAQAGSMFDYIYAVGGLNAMAERLAAVAAQPQASAPVAASMAGPRSCLISASPDDFAKLTLAIRSTIFPGEVSVRTEAEDPLRKRMAERCVHAEDWPLAYEETAGDFLFGEVRAQLYGQRLRQQGFDLSRLDAHIAALPNEGQHHLKWLYPNNSEYAKDWNQLTSLLNRKPQGDAEQTMVRNYINSRAQADRSLRIFEDMKGIDASTFISKGWQVLPALEASRPVIRERVLSKEEKAEVSRLARAYSAPIKDGGKRLTDLQRLMELAESGDKAAMIAARDGIARGMPFDLGKHYSYFDVTEGPFRQLTDRLAAMWTAMIWHRHGYDDASRKYMKACVGGLYGEIYKHEKDGVGAFLNASGEVVQVNSEGIVMDSTADGCGFTLLGVPAAQAKGRTILQFYDKRGSFAALGNRQESRDFAITGVRFSPIMGNALSLRFKLDEHIALRRKGLIFDSRSGQVTFSTPTLEVTRPWYEHYAREVGRFAEMEQADASANQAIAKRLREEGQAKLNRWNRALAAFKANTYLADRRLELQYAASELGGSYWTEYTRLVPDPYATGSAGSGPSRMIATGSGTNGYREVEVRSYDSNGTYTGSSRVSAAWADIMKMTSARKP